MIGSFIKGFMCGLSGFKLIQAPGIKRFVLIPLLINILIFSFILWFAIGQLSVMVDWMLNWLPAWLDWLSYLIWLLFGLIGLLIIFYTFTLIANFIAAPFNGFLAEKLEIKIGGLLPPSAGRPSTFASLKAAIRSEVQKLGYLLMWLIPLLLLNFVPLINLLMPFVWLVFGAWMLALEYMDYPMGNHEIPFAQQRMRARQYRFLLLGFGTCILIITLIPIVNFLAMPVAVAGATHLWVKHIEKP